MKDLTDPHNNQELFSNYYLNERLPGLQGLRTAEEFDEKIQKTDELIDQIVYRSYGSTEEENVGEG